MDTFTERPRISNPLNRELSRVVLGKHAMHKIERVGDTGSPCLTPPAIENFSEKKLLLAVLRKSIVQKVFNSYTIANPKQHFSTTRSIKFQLSESKA